MSDELPKLPFLTFTLALRFGRLKNVEMGSHPAAPSLSLFRKDSKLKMKEVSVALVFFLLFLSAVNINVVDYNASSVGGLMIPKLTTQSIVYWSHGGFASMKG